MKNEELRIIGAVRSGRHSSFLILHSSFIRLLFLRILALLAGPFARRRSEQPGSVLFIKPDHLGDLLLATPALAALRRCFPDARIVAIVGPWSEIVLRHNPDVDDMLICPFPGFTRRPTTDDRRPTTDDLESQRPETGHRRQRTTDDGRRTKQRSVVGGRWSVVKPYLTLLRYALLLRAGRYDLAIVGRDDHWWGAALALLAGIPRRVGFAVPECRPFLTDALPWDPRAHVTAQGLALVESAARGPWSVGARDIAPLRTTDYGPRAAGAAFPARFDPAPEDIAWADAWLRSQAGGSAGQLVVVHPGTGGPAKLWFPERWAAVADALAGAGTFIVLTGGPDEQALADQVAVRMRARPPTLAGQTTFGQLAALLRRARLVLGVDSGPLHLAAAQGVSTIHLYGPGDAGRFGPWGDQERHLVIRPTLWCSPCGVFDACPRGLARPECMELIEVARVVAEAQHLLTDDRS